MSDKNAAIVAVYPTYASAETALNALRAQGFATSDISVVAPRDAATPAPEMGAVSAEPAPEPGPIPALGVAFGWLVNMGAMAVSGAMLVAAGPIMAGLKGVTDALLGIADALVGFGLPVEDAKRYEDRVRDGAILLSVHADAADWITKGRSVFEQTGAEDISSMYSRRPMEQARLEVTHAE
jgi:hypothetical protein